MTVPVSDSMDWLMTKGVEYPVLERERSIARSKIWAAYGRAGRHRA